MRMKIDGQRVKEMRLRKSWSQEKLADLAGLNLRTVQRIETNGAASLQARLAIAKALGVDPVDLDRSDVALSKPDGAERDLLLFKDWKTLAVGCYALLTALSFGLVILDTVYANLINATLPSANASSVFHDVSEFLLRFAVITLPVFAAAVYASWELAFVRLLLLASMAVKVAIGAIALLLLPTFFPGSADWMDEGPGTFVRLTMHLTATALAFVAWIEHARQQRGVGSGRRREEALVRL